MTKSAFSEAYGVFRDLLRDLRAENGLTQRELARRLRVPQSFVSKYETGERRLDYVETAVVCEALKVELEEFARLFQGRLAGGAQSGPRPAGRTGTRRQ
jgi:transcriptional regulator with XRE-family HTH domain